MISAQQTLDLRQRILRPGQSVQLCHYAEDNLASTFHIGIFHPVEKDVVISNGTFIQQSHSLFPEARHPYRLRGMATDHSFQRKGLGRTLISDGLIELRKRNCDLLWFNARISAELFYRKLGFQVDDNVFDISLIGPHKVMYKWL